MYVYLFYWQNAVVLFPLATFSPTLLRIVVSLKLLVTAEKMNETSRSAAMTQMTEENRKQMDVAL